MKSLNFKGNKKVFDMELFRVILYFICAASYYPIFLYSSNVDEIKFNNVSIPLLVFWIIAGIIFVISYVILRSTYKAALTSIVLVILLENYRFIENPIQNVFSRLQYWHILPICLVVTLHILALIFRITNKESIKIVVDIIGFVFCILVAINVITALVTIISQNVNNLDQSNLIEDNDEAITNSDNISDGANIYYFVFDEGAAINVFEKYYNYDATEFRNFLKEHNFTVSEDSHNDCTNTRVVLTNVLNLDYILSAETISEDSSSPTYWKNYTSNSKLQVFLEQNGYRFIGVGDTGILGIESVSSINSNGAETIGGMTFLELLMSKTFLYPLYQQDSNQIQKMIIDTFDYFDGDIYDADHEFKFIYLKCPHQPFVFDDKGNAVSEAHYNDWDDDKYYRDQYSFMIDNIITTVDKIIENDPNSIIIISSDHGPRFNKNIIEGEALSESPKTNVLNAVYYKGESIESIQNKSSVNTLRTILSKQFDVVFSDVNVLYPDGIQ